MIEVILLTVLGAVTLGYLYMCHSYNYWRRKGLPQPPIVLGFGNLFDAFLMRNNPGLIYDEIYHCYKDHDAVGVYGFLTPKLLLRSPELIKRVIASDFSSFHDNEFYISKKLDPHFYMDPFCLKGEEWKVSRAKITAVMTPSKVKEIFPLMKETTQHLDDYLNEHLGDVVTKELATLFMMDNVSSTVFGITSNCFTDSKAAFRQVGDLLMNEQLRVWWKLMILVLMPKVRDLIGLKFIPTTVNDYVEKMVQEVFEYRLKNNLSRNDLFQQFMKKDTGNDLNELIFYGMTFFFEGFETSAMIASMALYELALNPQVQDTLYKEVRSTFDNEADIDFDTLSTLPYLDNVIQEAQRKYPIIFTITRQCTKAITLEIDGKPVFIELGTPVIIPVFSLQHDPQYFPNPEVFDPERFSEENKHHHPQYSYIPFGDGPRICPGIRFGLTQVKLFLAHMALKYRILRSEKSPQKFTFAEGSFLVTPNEEEWIHIEKRK